MYFGINRNILGKLKSIVATPQTAWYFILLTPAPNLDCNIFKIWSSAATSPSPALAGCG